MRPNIIVKNRKKINLNREIWDKRRKGGSELRFSAGSIGHYKILSLCHLPDIF